MGSSRWVVRVLKASVPFVVIVGLFAGALAWHLSWPVRQAATFHRLVQDDGSLAHDYGDAAMITMQRYPCLNSCPAYVVRIHGSGVVDFDGQAFVCIRHPLTDRVLRVTAQRLIDAMVQTEFAQLSRERRIGPTDGPLTSTTLDLGTSRDRVDDGGAPDMAPVVPEIERQIDRAAGTARWKRIPRNDGAQQPFCAMPDGTKKVFDEAGQLVDEDASSAKPSPSTPPDAPRS